MSHSEESGCARDVPAVHISPPVQVADAALLAEALNAILNLDLGVTAERLVRREVAEILVRHHLTPAVLRRMLHPA